MITTKEQTPQQASQQSNTTSNAYNPISRQFLEQMQDLLSILETNAKKGMNKRLEAYSLLFDISSTSETPEKAEIAVTTSFILSKKELLDSDSLELSRLIQDYLVSKNNDQLNHRHNRNHQLSNTTISLKPSNLALFKGQLNTLLNGYAHMTKIEKDYCKRQGWFKATLEHGHIVISPLSPQSPLNPISVTLSVHLDEYPRLNSLLSKISSKNEDDYLRVSFNSEYLKDLIKTLELSESKGITLLVSKTNTDKTPILVKTNNTRLRLHKNEYEALIMPVLV